jgi:N-acetylmuramoyl-L-alanine amidase
MAATKPYVIREGDHLERIAAAIGADAKTIWNLADNAPLRKVRKDYNVLLAGDIVYLPQVERKWLSVDVGSKNEFVATVPSCTVTHTFTSNGQPLANQKYTLVGLPAPVDPKTTDGSGTATFDVPIDTERVRVVFDGGQSFLLNVGHLDPANEPSGCAQRLVHLGYLGAGPDDAENAKYVTTDEARAWVSFALASFQTDQGLPSTGQLDDATVAKLVQVYGC